MELYPIDIAIHLVNIGVLYVLLRVLVWKPVVAFMAAREARIAGQLREAEELKAQAQELKNQYDSQLADVKNTCDQMLSDGRREAQATVDQYLSQAQEQAASIVSQAKTDAQEEKLRPWTRQREIWPIWRWIWPGGFSASTRTFIRICSTMRRSRAPAPAC